MAVTPSGIVSEVKFVVDIPLGKNDAVKVSGATSKKASLPTEVTLVGISTETKEVQPEKASSPIAVTGKPAISAGSVRHPSSGNCP